MWPVSLRVQPGSHSVVTEVYSHYQELVAYIFGLIMSLMPPPFPNNIPKVVWVFMVPGLALAWIRIIGGRDR